MLLLGGFLLRRLFDRDPVCRYVVIGLFLGASTAWLLLGHAWPFGLGLAGFVLVCFRPPYSSRHVNSHSPHR